MITQPHSKKRGKPQLSSEGQERRDEMLPELLDAMSLHHSRRRSRQHVFKLSALLLVLVSSSSWMIWQSLMPNESKPNTTAEVKRTDVEPVQSKEIRSNDLYKKVAPKSSKSLNPSKTSIHLPPRKKTMVEKYVVSTVNIQTRQMESIDDEEMLELLNQAGVRGWIAEIGDERVVLDNDGKRL